MKISDVAAAAGCSVRSVRHLHERGVVPEPARTSGNYRDYSVSDLVAVIRARALIDAGVPVADIEREDAVQRSIAMLDGHIAHLERQRSRLLAIAEAPAGCPRDISDKLADVIDDAALLQIELDSWDLMALTGVATEATWAQLRANLKDASCVEAARKSVNVWGELGAMHSRDVDVPQISATLSALFARGIMRDVLPTLRQGSVPLQVKDLPTRGAQRVVLEELTRDI